MKKSTYVLFASLILFMSFMNGAFAQLPSASFSWTPNSPCVGATVQITSTSTNTGIVTGYGYSVSGSSTPTVLVQNPVVTFTAAGNQTVILALLQGTIPVGSATNVIVVQAGPSLSITANPTTAICPGSTVSLNVQGPGTYSWVAPISGTNASQTATVTSNTTYSVVGTGTNGCSSTQTIAITTVTNPLQVTTTKTLLCVGETATLTASGNGSGYAWSTTPLPTLGATLAVSPTTQTTYTVGSTGGGTCPTATWTSVFTQSVSPCTGLQPINAINTELMVYPNPSKGDLIIELNNGNSKSIEIFDITGKIIISESTTRDRLHLNLNNAPQGIYFVRVLSNNDVKVVKIIKE